MNVASYSPGFFRRKQDVPGLFQQNDGTVWYRKPNGDEAEIGSGGGSLPAWWIVDSTPGEESVDFGGAVTISPSDPEDDVLVKIKAPVGFLDTSGEGVMFALEAEDGTRIFEFSTWNDLTIRPTVGNEPAVVRLWNLNETGVFQFAAPTGNPANPVFRCTLNGSETTFAVREVGTTEITPNDPAVPTMLLRTAAVYVGTGSPELVVTAPVGSLFLRSDGGSGTTLYVKQSGAGDTGWSGK